MHSIIIILRSLEEGSVLFCSTVICLHGVWASMVVVWYQSVISIGNVYHVLYSRGCVSSLVPFMKVGLMIDTLQANNWFSEMQKKEQYEKNTLSQG